MKNEENRGIRNHGRRLTDGLTPGMLIASGLVNLMGDPAKTVIKWVMPTILAWVIGDALLKIVHALKGTTTLANIQIGLSAALSVNPEGGQASDWPLLCDLLMYSAVGTTIIACVAVLYAYRERALRNQTIREMGLQITTLEKFFDQYRSSSGLTTSGNTHPKDE